MFERKVTRFLLLTLLWKQTLQLSVIIIINTIDLLPSTSNRLIPLPRPRLDESSSQCPWLSSTRPVYHHHLQHHYLWTTTRTTRYTVWPCYCAFPAIADELVRWKRISKSQPAIHAAGMGSNDSTRRHRSLLLRVGNCASTQRIMRAHARLAPDSTANAWSSVCRPATAGCTSASDDPAIAPAAEAALRSERESGRISSNFVACHTAQNVESATPTAAGLDVTSTPHPGRRETLKVETILVMPYPTRKHRVDPAANAYAA